MHACLQKKAVGLGERPPPQDRAEGLAPVDPIIRGTRVNSKSARKFQLVPHLRLQSRLFQFLQLASRFCESAIPLYRCFARQMQPRLLFYVAKDSIDRILQLMHL